MSEKLVVLLLMALVCMCTGCIAGPIGPEGPAGRQGLVGPQGKKGDPGADGSLCKKAINFSFVMKQTRQPQDKVYSEFFKFRNRNSGTEKIWYPIDFPAHCFPRDQSGTYWFPTAEIKLYLYTPTGKGRLFDVDKETDFIQIEFVPRDKADDPTCCFQSEAPDVYLQPTSGASMNLFGYLTPIDIQQLYQMNKKNTKLALRAKWYFTNKEFIGYQYNGTFGITFIKDTN